jgi:putative ABC transport system substrate-binding protein
MVAARGVATAQQAPLRVVWLATGTAAEDQPRVDALRSSLRELGYVEGRHLVIDARWANYSAARVEALAAATAAEMPSLIVTIGPAAIVMRRATKTIPIVFAYSGDPVLAGLVDSFARPGGNCTGISFLALDLVGKRIDLLKAVMPGLRRLAILASPEHFGDRAERRASEVAAAAVGLEVEYFELVGAAQLDAALEAIRAARHDAVLMFPVQSITGNSARIADWSRKHRIAAVSGWARFAEAGNLMAYGANLQQSFQRVATYVDRIVKGARPADLAVEVPQHFELVINLKTARDLGVTVPASVLLRADHVID